MEKGDWLGCHGMGSSVDGMDEVVCWWMDGISQQENRGISFHDQQRLKYTFRATWLISNYIFLNLKLLVCYALPTEQLVFLDRFYAYFGFFALLSIFFAKVLWWWQNRKNGRRFILNFCDAFFTGLRHFFRKSPRCGCILRILLCGPIWHNTYSLV